MTSAVPTTIPTVFISYSHDSPKHAGRVLSLANRLVRDGVDCVLDQYEISPPEGWARWMDRHIRGCDFVLMVCTETYYRRVMDEEEPGKGRGVRWEGNLIYQHIYNADSENTRFIPVLLESGKVEHIPTPLQGATHYRVHSRKGYEDLYRRLTDQPLSVKLPPRERKQDFFAARVSLAKLPSTSPDLFGREEELATLDAAWDDADTNVLSLVAWGGVGKTALVNKWLLQMGADGYRGAQRVYGWSFYSQGAAEGKQTSAELFIAKALEWFGDPNPTAGSPWDKGERLAELVKGQRTLLVLDGLEPLQHPPPVETGRIKDPGLCCLLRELARHNPGLCLITTRLVVDDLKDFVGSSVQRVDLAHLSPEAGVAYLKHLAVRGTAEELKQAVQEFEGHSLALTLLGSYLAGVYEGDIRKRDKIAKLAREPKQGANARRVMESYERWFKGRPELDILRLMGLFDRPAEGGGIEALRAEPAIQGLTEDLQGLSHEEWRFAVANLRTARLLAGEDPQSPNTLDCHPLLREHFGEKLQRTNPEAWREAHSRLYEYYAALPEKDLPDTLEEMMPLYAALAHGCQAGRHQEALDKVYWHRINRLDEFFSTRYLGAFGADLAALSGFFDPPWHQPVVGLTEAAQAWLLTEAGFRLRALGRLAEAAQPLQGALEAAIARSNWRNGAIAAGNLSELSLNRGDLAQALDFARQGVELVDRSTDDSLWMALRTALADALHQAGRLDEAAVLFGEAEQMQKEDQPRFPLLYSFQGYLYCDLLLGQGKVEEVQRRASQTLEWARTQNHLLDIARDHLSLGRAHLLQAQQEGTGDYTQAGTHLNQAVDGLRQAGQQDDLPRGLLPRAALYRLQAEFGRAGRDLEEALSLATRGGMRLFAADAHLEQARLYLAMGEMDKASASLTQAKTMIEEMGFRRRDGEVAELEVLQ